ncbi:hypothetical protein A374_09658 [Fictibacillus macauensis ZFHKF-1]|uniref:UPF0354 protein A374_09658 n=1 Tax=Fictibacillus macauensis ZFHKF-1 TaxID=1196324 RepID=I8UFB6_9BACL|nr:DUF1444 domain-containing protein [Fictibacillus macauensis]EIT85493.1 hypothetical protein A374_09658 [Fictibacillus macauensis ZFHKF-1]
MTSLKLKKQLEARLQRPQWTTAYDRETEEFRVEDVTTKKGITLSLAGLSAQWDQKKEALIDELVYHVEEALTAATKTVTSAIEKVIFPVIRSTSFPKETPEHEPLIYDEHTAETAIYYAVDLGKTYRLLTEKLMQEYGLKREQVKEIALFNARSLTTSLKKDEVAGNIFYFLNHNDGYDASRILNTVWLDEMAKQMQGTMVVAVPHQDVLILADIRNNQGYDIVAQMAMQFFMNGRVPVTALPFIYENSTLDPIFILAKNKPVEE